MDTYSITMINTHPMWQYSDIGSGTRPVRERGPRPPADTCDFRDPTARHALRHQGGVGSDSHRSAHHPADAVCSVQAERISRHPGRHFPHRRMRGAVHGRGPLPRSSRGRHRQAVVPKSFTKGVCVNP